MTVLEAIQRSSDFLAKKGVDSPRLQSELLLAHALRLRRMQLYLSFERVLTDPETAALRDMIKRRGQREPLQHIVGSTSFCGLELLVNRDVLVPRPETELLAEEAWKFVLSLPGAVTPSVLDFGTGSGCLAISVAHHCPNAEVLAMDASAAALEMARQNAEALSVAARIRFLEGSTLESLPPEELFHLIVSNPPYIPGAEIPGLQPEVRDFDPHLALDGGADGLDFYRQLALQAANRLQNDGRMMLEFGDDQAPAITAILEAQNWVVEAIRQDYTQRPRFLVARRK